MPKARRGGAVATVTVKDKDGNVTSSRTYATDPSLVAAVTGGTVEEPTVMDQLSEPGPLGVPMGLWGLGLLGGLAYVVTS